MIIRTLINKDKKFVLSEDIKELCEKYKLDYRKTKVILLNKGFIKPILRGIFYVKDFNEKKIGVLKYSPDELVAKGLETKGIKNWYFGLRTGLKFLNVTHEYFTREWILNDAMKRVPRAFAGVTYEFVKIKPLLFRFGIKTKKTKNGILIKYSDIEKTLLDIAYLDKKNGKSDTAAKKIFIEYEDRTNKKLLKEYSKNYPKSVQKLIV